MKKIGILKNTVQDYAWGSLSAIAELLGEQPSPDRPQAELWMGAHPKAPSMVICNGEQISLPEWIKKNPEDILGEEVANKFNGQLPYLFKVLAAAKPLSIQAHPDLKQAREGFARENKLGIPFNAPNRNYKDDNHKPECICALTTFWALNGFRSISDILPRLEMICRQGLEKELDDFRKNPNARGLKFFFYSLLNIDQKRQKQLVDDAIAEARKFSEEDPVFQWMINLYNEYPSDIGVFSPVLLNLICLEPGQAMFLPARDLHSYLDGVGIELMANSDNVLRGGLTPKHIDLQELIRVLNFEETEIEVISPHKLRDCESIYQSRAEEFVLSVISVKESMAYNSPTKRSVEILLCTKGKGAITGSGGEDKIVIAKGGSVIVPAIVEGYRLEGDMTLYKAGVPV